MSSMLLTYLFILMKIILKISHTNVGLEFFMEVNMW